MISYAVKMGWFRDGDRVLIPAIARVDALMPPHWRVIRDRFDSFNDFVKSLNSRKVDHGLTNRQVMAIRQAIRDGDDSVTHQLVRHKIKIITIDDQSYPAILKEISDPPLWLFYRGNLKALDQPCLSVVGTRKPTTYTKSALFEVLSRRLLTNITTVSGLAYGVDKLVHLRSLEANGLTGAILAGGLDAIYPKAHQNLAQEIIENNGVLLSEYPPGVNPLSYRFPIRNRIIVGLSRATLIVQAAINSGTQVSARLALEENREVLAIPGDITNKMSELPNSLILQGALPIINNRQLEELYGLDSNQQSNEVDKNVQEILNLIENPVLVDDLCRQLNKDTEAILAMLTELELEGMVKQVEPGIFQKIR